MGGADMAGQLIPLALGGAEAAIPKAVAYFGLSSKGGTTTDTAAEIALNQLAQAKGVPLDQMQSTFGDKLPGMVQNQIANLDPASMDAAAQAGAVAGAVNAAAS